MPAPCLPSVPWSRTRPVVGQACGVCRKVPISVSPWLKRMVRPAIAASSTTSATTCATSPRGTSEPEPSQLMVKF